jgi:hypothetical protein
VATLSEDEIARIKRELGDHVMDVGAEPYFGYRSAYAVVRDYVSSSSTPATSSATTVAAAGATTITVASATGLTTGTRVQLDVDQSRETVTVRDVTGLVVSVICRKPHSGTYPVEIESALTLVRGLISDLIEIEQGRLPDTFATAGIKRVDEVEFRDGADPSLALDQARARLRRELAHAVGLGSTFDAGRGVGAVEVY